MVKKSLSALFIGIIGLIIVAVTLSIFFLTDYKRTAISWWALSSVLLSEIVLFVGLEIIGAIKSQLNKVFIIAGVSSTLILYLFAAIISCFFTRAFKDNVNLFITIQIIIIAITAILIILISIFSHHINTIDQKNANNQNSVQPKRGGF